ncbi:MAG TPA: hypothetical protein VJ876_08270 [Bacteroidales bacterium]|nr:hypothetical protein [Bacteroidales bacterium]
MTTRIALFFILAAALSGCSNQEAREEASTVTTMDVGQLMENPAAHLDQSISVSGVVTHVCKHGGKRLHLSQSGSDQKVRVRTGKNMSPFDRELEGSTVQITGTFVEERLDEAYLNQLRKGQEEGDHHHEDHSDDDKAAQAAEQGQVSEAFIQEMEQKIEQSEKGYIVEYWLNAEKVEKTNP